MCMRRRHAASVESSILHSLVNSGGRVTTTSRPRQTSRAEGRGQAQGRGQCALETTTLQALE
eukprot:scaffold330_cov109-Isochrysis_galbana.AAC.13